MQALADAALGTLSNPLILSPVLFFGGMLLMLLIGNPMIDWLRAKRWKKGTTLDATWAVREDTPVTHQQKQGTPSMGGLGILAAALVTYAGIAITAVSLQWLGGSRDAPPSVYTLAAFLLLPVCTAAHGMLGFADDWSKASGRGGLRARTKLVGQLLLAVSFVVSLIFLSKTQAMTGVRYRFSGLSCFDNGWLWLLGLGFLVVVMIAASNAVNLTDGIDGLAAGLAVTCGLAFFLVGCDFNEVGVSAIIFWLALAGACFGFLNFNKHKARVFMGDTGSLAIGAALGVGAILLHAVFLLPFIGFIYFVEAASVTLQVLWFKWTKRRTGEGKRLFRRAPLHHHFELGGWSEWRVVLTFWAVNLVTSIIGLWLWIAGVIPRWP
jgi:phospho-N-acetylmuramoyl-pentapeptide-transferase